MKYFTLTKLKAPTMAGWYQTRRFTRSSQCRTILQEKQTSYRYWDGSYWSVSVGCDHTTEAAQRLSMIKLDHADNPEVGYIEKRKNGHERNCYCQI